MADATREKAIDRLLKLWKVTEANNATPAEAELAVTRMRKMMAEHELSIADLEAEETRRTGKKKTLNMTHAAAYTRKGLLARYDHVMAQTAAVLTNTKCFLDNWRDEYHAKYQSMSFIGTPEDIEIAAQLFHAFLKQARFFARLQFGPTWGQKHTSFCMGFGYALHTRAKDWMGVVAPAQQAQYALIVANKADAIVAYEQSHLQMRETKNRKMSLDPAAWHAGKRKGDTIDLGVGQKLRGKA